MKTNRHVPLIIGGILVVLALWLILGFKGWGWWRFIAATFCLMFGWPTLKTGLFASDIEIEELTGIGPVSQDTIDKFKDRL